MLNITDNIRLAIIKILIFIIILILFFFIYDYFEAKKQLKNYEEEQKKIETLNVNNNKEINEIKKKLPDSSDVIARRKLLEKIYQ